MSLASFLRRLAARQVKPRGKRGARRTRRPILEALEDRTLLAMLTVNSTADDNVRDHELTLREAILLAEGILPFSNLAQEEKNQVSGTPALLQLDTIAFNIGGGGLQTIQLLSSLPGLADPVVIDGSSQPGYVGSPLIELDGWLAGESNGLVIFSQGSTVRGLIINRFQLDGIMLFG